uniref:I-set domain-containing protein n=1 Tax=Macrostomum lignano TaxID=282301 RepID=A0A1I8FHP5_9PLAT
MIRIEVLCRPRINARPYQIVQAKLNYQIELELCSVTGDPRPTIVVEEGHHAIGGERQLPDSTCGEASVCYITNLRRLNAACKHLRATNPAGVALCPVFSSRLCPSIREVPSVVKQAFANQDVTLEIARPPARIRKATDSGTFLCVAKNDGRFRHQLPC